MSQSQKVITANRLKDGAVVYFTADGHWSTWLSEAGIADTDEQNNSLLAAAQANKTDVPVIEPYSIDVRTEGATIKPVRYREAIRAKGPTTHPQHGRPTTASLNTSADSAFQNGL